MNEYIIIEILTCCKVITGAVLLLGALHAADIIRKWVKKDDN